MRGKNTRSPELERNADHAAEAARLISDKLDLAPDFWRKRAEEASRLAEVIEDNFTAETLVDIALQYDKRCALLPAPLLGSPNEH
jgi:hypothetical protein